MTDALRHLLPDCPIKSDFTPGANTAETHGVSPVPLAQNGASESARQGARSADDSHSPSGGSDLGEPLSIHDVAVMLGCSAWTVRQRYLQQGLPHLRACAGGRIVFFREQVIAWILKRQQQKGGLRR